jgi:hypothetical protein
MDRRRGEFTLRLLGAGLAVPAVASSLPAWAGSAACPPDPVICCRLAAKQQAVKPAAPAFGVQIWPSELARDPPAVDRLIDLRPRHLRFALGPNWRRQPPLRNGMSDAELDTAVAAGFAAQRLAGPVTQILDLIRRRTSAHLHLVVWEPPPLPGEPDLRRPGTPAPRHLRGENIGLMARFLVATLKYIGGQGLHLDAVELSNEPDGNWNIRIDPADYLSLVRAVRAEAGRRAVALPRIFGPGTSTIGALRHYLADPATARGILDSVDVLSVHGWDNPHEPDRFVELAALYADLERLNRSPELAMTEYGIARPDPDDSSDRMNVKKRAPDGVALTPFFASLTARDMIRFYGKGIGTIIYWEYQDQRWGRASFGLLDENGKAKPLYDALRGIAERLAAERPGRLDLTRDGRLALMHAGSRDTLLVANPTGGALGVVFGNVRPDPGAGDPRLAPCTGHDGEAGLAVPAWAVISVPIVRP